jgi:[protein-PII] uridylyltransferase
VALAADLRRVAAGDVSVTQRLRARAMSARGGRGVPAGGLAPRGGHRRGGAGAARGRLGGLLYRVATALDEAGAESGAARISTLGGDVVDAFYLVVLGRRTAWSESRRRLRGLTEPAPG